MLFTIGISLTLINLGSGCIRPPPPPPANPCSLITIVRRAEWGAARATARTPFNTPAAHVFIHHTDGSRCTTTSACKRVVKGIQNYHMRTRRWSDIGYSFLIGGDGKVYEGRGWNNVGAHTKGYNSVGYGISFMGKYSSALPSSSMLNAAKNLIKCGVRQGHISTSYSLSGHRDAVCTSCPGTTLYNHISTWPNWHRTPIPRPSCSG